MSIDEFIEILNEYGANRVPFLSLVDFEMQKPVVIRLDAISAEHIMYDINGNTNVVTPPYTATTVGFTKSPPGFANYKKKFDSVWSRLMYGDSYLTNLTIKTRITTPHTLKEIFFLGQAKYKLWFDEQFLVFSPETFIRIEDGIISSYPMKGTIDATLPRAAHAILNDSKEMAEHVTIVDLIRNDLSTVADRVSVTRFRYIDEIRTMQKNLLQVSSEIRGELAPGYEGRLGTILVSLLPAGSVSGAPKRKTVEIIRNAEEEARGYYTGVVGLFDGKKFDSGVMIRFMERSGNACYYRSGGGITVQSQVESEYQEAIDKVYVPFA